MDELLKEYYLNTDIIEGYMMSNRSQEQVLEHYNKELEKIKNAIANEQDIELNTLTNCISSLINITRSLLFSNSIVLTKAPNLSQETILGLNEDELEEFVKSQKSVISIGDINQGNINNNVLLIMGYLNSLKKKLTIKPRMTEDAKTKAINDVLAKNSAFKYIINDGNHIDLLDEDTDKYYLQNPSKDIEYKRIKQDTLGAYMPLLGGCNNDDPEFIREIEKHFNEIIHVWYDDILDSQSNEALYQKCKYAHEQIREEYEKFKRAFYDYYKIDGRGIDTKLDYDCSFSQFYAQLKEIGKKHSNLYQFEMQLFAEIEKMRNRKVYGNLSLEIKRYVDDTLNLARLDENFSLDSKLLLVKREIENLVNRHNNNNKRLEEIKNYLKDKYQKMDGLYPFYDIKFISQISGLSAFEIRLYNEIFNYSFDYHKETLAEIEKRLQNWEERIKLEKAKISSVNEIIVSLNEKYNVALNQTIDSDIIQKIDDLMNSISLLFKKFELGLVDVKEIMHLNEITFSNLALDKKVISGINTNVIHNIYLKRSLENYGDDSSLFWLKVKNGCFYLEKIGKNSYKSKTYFNLVSVGDDFIALDTILQYAKFIDVNISDSTNSFHLIYHAEIDRQTYDIGFINGKIIIYVNWSLPKYYIPYAPNKDENVPNFSKEVIRQLIDNKALSELGYNMEEIEIYKKIKRL